jgi:hypothetical protein
MAITTGPEFNKLWDCLEEKAKQINFALDQIESGAATILTDEDLKDI